MILMRMEVNYETGTKLFAEKIIKREQLEEIDNFFDKYQFTTIQFYEGKEIKIEKKCLEFSYITTNQYKILKDLEFKDFGYVEIIDEILYLADNYASDTKKSLSKDIKTKNIYEC